MIRQLYYNIECQVEFSWKKRSCSNMKQNYREFYWKRLDNAAKGFSAISNNNNTNVYRLSVKLKIPIEQDVLQNAVERTLVDIPSFNVKQRKGLFWYYLESNFAKPPVREENSYPCLRMERGQDNGFMFRVTYYGCKINLEVFHSLTDGTGALIFLNRLLYNYLSIKFTDQKLTECGFFEKTDHPDEYEEDSFLKNYTSEQKKTSHTAEPAYRIRGVNLERKVTHVITGVMPVKQVASQAKANGVTITEYLTAVLIQSIYCAATNLKNRSTRPIVVCIPVNLRGFYDSRTLSNFFSYLNIGVLFSSDYSFEEILGFVKQEFEQELKREKIEEKLRYNVEAERNMIIRFIPLFIKRFGLRVIHDRGERGQTCALSNLGVVSLPADIAQYIERYDILVSISTLKQVKAGVISFNGKLSFTFTSSIYETSIQQYFFSFLSARGIETEIITNEI